MSEKSIGKTLDYILNTLEQMSWEKGLNGKEFKSSQWYDKWEHSNHFVDGSYDGYLKAIDDITILIQDIKKEESK